MKKIIQLVFLLTSISLAQFVTPNTGVNWDLDSLVLKSGGKITGAFPDYQINDSIRVSAKDKLVIKAGSKVSFTTLGSAIEVNGIFQCAGDSLNYVLLTAPVADSAVGAYQGIKFSDPSIDSLCFIKWTRIQYAYCGFRAINASPTLYNCYLFKNRRGIMLSYSNAVIMLNRIERSYEYGINLTLDSSPYIILNEILNNNTKNTSAMNQISIGLQGNNSPIIRYNKVYGVKNTKTGGISLWVQGTGAYSNIVIDNNLIYNNSFGITLYGSGGGAINGIVSNNTIYNNNINPDVMTTGSGINFNGGSLVKPIVTRNVIFGNWWGITIQSGTAVQAGPQPMLGDLTNADTSDNGYNKIYDNIQGTNVFDLYNNCTNDIMAQNNDWGVYDSVSIEKHIFHKVDSVNRGRVVFTPFYNPGQIPVELVSFTASQAGSGISLRWLTATETNNSGFEVQKAVGNNNYEKVAFVKGHGTTASVKSYEFKDTDLPTQSQVVKYRLKQVDYDGTSDYSSEVEVNYNVPKKFELSQNYPNPFNPSTVINFQVPAAGKVTLKVFNILGKEVATLLNKEMNAGSHSIKFNAANLSSGLYFYTLTTGSYSSTKKMILIK